MKKSLLCLALALVAALSVPSFAAVTTGATGNPVNATLTIPAAAGTMACANVAVSTFAPTQLLAARSSGIRQGLYIINASTTQMNGAVSSRIPDIIWSTNAALPIVAASAFAQSPGWLLHPAANAAGSTSQATNATSAAKMDGSGIPSGAIYAVAESSNVTTNVQAFATACEWY